MKNVLIINLASLYEIMHELKENLSFNVIKISNEKNLKEIDQSIIMSYLIVSRDSSKLLLNNDITDENLLDLKDLPLSLKKLLELINIKLIKLKFNQQSKIQINEYELDLNSKFFSKGDLKLKLTEKEIEVILYLNNKKVKHDVLDLQKNIWGYSADTETHTVETHIYRLRKKISALFNDDKFILTHKNGYYI